MIKFLLVGVWGCLVALGSVYLTQSMNHSPGAEAEQPQKQLKLITLKPITVPVLGKEAIDGYLLAVLGINVDSSNFKSSEADAEVILHDIAFRTLYGVEALRYRKPRKADLETISQELKEAMNKRLGVDGVKEVLLQEFSFVPKEQTRSPKRE